MKHIGFVLALGACFVTSAAADRLIGVNVVLKQPVSQAITADLAKYGALRDVIPEINGLTMQTRESQLAAIQALPYVAAAGPDAERKGAPTAAIPVSDFGGGMNTWNLDAINVTNFGQNVRAVDYDGLGTYVAVLDTGLLNSWQQYFPKDRIAVELARCFGGGGGSVGFVSTQPNKWGQDQDSHGTHVTSTILGYSFFGTYFNGVAPKATIIPVKVLNQNGNGWSSVIARGIVYVGDLKADSLKSNPVIINMSLGGSRLDPLEKAAIDYAISKGVIVVASAGNEGTAGMGYPGAYEPVISVAAAGWTGEWMTRNWWNGLDVAEKSANFYIADFSSRQKAGQDLDVAAPGSWVLGPYQTDGQLSYYFLGGTSMASPHVAGVVALMAQKNPSLTAAQAESILEESAKPLAAGCTNVLQPGGLPKQECWGGDATGAGLADAAAALDKTK